MGKWGFGVAGSHAAHRLTGGDTMVDRPRPPRKSWSDTPMGARVMVVMILIIVGVPMLAILWRGLLLWGRLVRWLLGA